MSRTYKDTKFRKQSDGIGCRWPRSGRWWKRALAKARRRYIRAQLLGIKGKEPTGYESEVNWKTW